MRGRGSGWRSSSLAIVPQSILARCKRRFSHLRHARRTPYRSRFLQHATARDLLAEPVEERHAGHPERGRDLAELHPDRTSFGEARALADVFALADAACRASSLRAIWLSRVRPARHNSTVRDAEHARRIAIAFADRRCSTREGQPRKSCVSHMPSISLRVLSVNHDTTSRARRIALDLRALVGPTLHA